MEKLEEVGLGDAGLYYSGSASLPAAEAPGDDGDHGGSEQKGERERTTSLADTIIAPPSDDRGGRVTPLRSRLFDALLAVAGNHRPAANDDGGSGDSGDNLGGDEEDKENLPPVGIFEASYALSRPRQGRPSSSSSQQPPSSAYESSLRGGGHASSVPRGGDECPDSPADTITTPSSPSTFRGDDPGLLVDTGHNSAGGGGGGDARGKEEDDAGDDDLNHLPPIEMVGDGAAHRLPF